jgi:hypothetical protein
MCGGGMKASELKHLYERNNPEGHFFDRDTMRFFGNTMRNFGVRDGGKVDTLATEGLRKGVEVWELYRKRPVKYGLHGHCCYFSKLNLREISSWRQRNGEKS